MGFRQGPALNIGKQRGLPNVLNQIPIEDQRVNDR